MTKEIEGYEAYTITQEGDVYSTKWNTPRKLKPQRATQSKKGYYQIRLYDESGELGKLKYVHRVVWETFRGEIPDGLEIDHMDGDTSNNSLANLQVLTRKQNTNKYQRETLGILLRERRNELCQDYDTLGTFKKVAEKWGVSITAVNRVVRNRLHCFNKITRKYGTQVYDPNIQDKWSLN